MSALDIFFSLSPLRDHPDLHSFPTRRSSDLPDRHEDRRVRRSRARRGVAFGAGFAPGHPGRRAPAHTRRSEEHTSELQSRFDLVCRLLLEKKNKVTSLKIICTITPI